MNYLERKELAQVSFRVPRVLKDLIKRYLVMDLHMNESEFFRDAIREKLMREAPELYKQLFQSELNKPKKEGADNEPRC